MPEAVSNAELAAFLDVTPSTIGDLAAKGRVVRIGRGKYDLKASTRAYVGHLREAAAGRAATNEELRAEKIRLTAAQADMAEMTKAERALTMVDVREFENRWSDEMSRLRQAFLSLSTKISAALPGLTRHEVVVVDETVRLLLERLSEGAADSSPPPAGDDAVPGKPARGTREPRQKRTGS